MGNARHDRPGTETRKPGLRVGWALRDGNGQVLMPGNLPVGPRRLSKKRPRMGKAPEPGRGVTKPFTIAGAWARAAAAGTRRSRSRRPDVSPRRCRAGETGSLEFPAACSVSRIRFPICSSERTPLTMSQPSRTSQPSRWNVSRTLSDKYGISGLGGLNPEGRPVSSRNQQRQRKNRCGFSLQSPWPVH